MRLFILAPLCTFLVGGWAIAPDTCDPANAQNCPEVEPTVLLQVHKQGDPARAGEEQLEEDPSAEPTPAPATPTDDLQLVERACAADYNEDCRTSKCCKSRGFKCYEKDQWWAGCYETCADKVGWSCKVLSPSAPTPAPTCAGDYNENCRQSQCCKSRGWKCIEQNQWWSGCYPPTVPTPAPRPVCAADYNENCMYSKCCKTPGFQCIAQNQWWSGCYPAAPTPAPTPKPGCAANYNEDCRTSKCCKTPGFKCYEKDQWWAGCYETCADKPGWSCKVLSRKNALIATGDSPPTETDATTESIGTDKTTDQGDKTTDQGVETTEEVIDSTQQVVDTTKTTGLLESGAGRTCSANYNDDCRTTKCCKTPGFTCYEKDQWWAGCYETCADKVGWSCKVLSPTTPTPAPACAGDYNENCKQSQCCKSPGWKCIEQNQWWSGCYPPTPTPAPTPAGCAGDYNENCMHSKCCKTPGFQCIEQNQWWSGCYPVAPTPAPTPKPGCAAKYSEDCRTSKCCQTPGFTCYEKDQWWAGCYETCADKVGWSCRVLRP